MREMRVRRDIVSVTGGRGKSGEQGDKCGP